MTITPSVVRVPKDDVGDTWIRLHRDGYVIAHIAFDDDEAVFFLRGTDRIIRGGAS